MKIDETTLLPRNIKTNFSDYCKDCKKAVPYVTQRDIYYGKTHDTEFVISCRNSEACKSVVEHFHMFKED